MAEAQPKFEVNLSVVPIVPPLAGGYHFAAKISAIYQLGTDSDAPLQIPLELRQEWWGRTKHDAEDRALAAAKHWAADQGGALVNVF